MNENTDWGDIEVFKANELTKSFNMQTVINTGLNDLLKYIAKLGIYIQFPNVINSSDEVVCILRRCKDDSSIFTFIWRSEMDLENIKAGITKHF